MEGLIKIEVDIVTNDWLLTWNLTDKYAIAVLKSVIQGLENRETDDALNEAKKNNRQCRIKEIGISIKA